MRGTDKYLIIFAAGVAVLVIAALIVTASRPEKTYRDGTDAEDVAYNYLLAFENADYERAYELLSPELDEYPADIQEFVRQVNRDNWLFPTMDESASTTLLSVREGEGWATADVHMTTYRGSGLFGPNRYSEEFQLVLEEVDGSWKISGGERFFLYCWSEGDCR